MKRKPQSKYITAPPYKHKPLQLISVVLLCMLLTVLPLLLPKAQFITPIGLAVALLIPIPLYLFGQRFGFAASLAYGLIAAVIMLSLCYEKILSGCVFVVNTAVEIPLTVSGSLPNAAALPYASVFFTLISAALSVYAVGEARPYPYTVAVLFGVLTVCLAGFELRLLCLCALLLCLSVCHALYSSNTRGRAKAGLIFYTILLIAGFSAVFLGSKAFMQSELFAALSSNNTAAVQELREGIERMRYDADIRFTPLPNGDLRNVSNVAYTGNIVLSATLQVPQLCYFRTFSGDSFTNNVWRNAEQLNGENKALFLYLEQKGFYPALQLALFSAMAYDTSYSMVKVDNHALSSKYAVMPYNAALSADLLSPVTQFIGDTQAAFAVLQPPRSYSFITAAPAVKGIIADKALEKLSANITDKEQLALFDEAEELYRSFVYEHYLEVGAGEAELLNGLFSEEQIAAMQSFSHRKLTAMLQKYHTDNYAVSTGEPPIPAGYGLLSNFIRTKKGYAVHFATMSTLLFRMAGIPARYVEGYCLSESDVAMYTEVNNITFEIPDSYAHAWTEIYIDRLGWVPAETTPGFFTLPADTQTDDGINDVLKDNPVYFYTREQEAMPDAEIEPPEEQEEPAAQSSRAKQLLIAAAVIIILLLLLLPLIIRRLRYARFAGGEINRRIIRIYTEALRLLHAVGRKESAYMQESIALFAELCPDIGQEAIVGFVQAAYCARFGSCQFSEAEAAAVCRALFAIRRSIWHNAGPLHKLRLYLMSL